MIDSSLVICVKLICFWMSFRHTVSDCSLPFYYDSIYVRSEKNEVHANSSILANYPINSPFINDLDFSCAENQENTFLLRSTEQKDLLGALTRLYLCLEIYTISNETYVYYHRTGYNVFLHDYIYGKKIVEATFEEVCTVTTDRRTFYMMVKAGAHEDGLLNTTCPQDILAVFASLNITSSTGTKTSNCPGTTVDVCTDRTTLSFSYNDTCASARTTSATGNYSCLYSTTIDTVTYLGVWNQDTTVDETSNFRFSCIAYSISSGVLYATETPGNCTSTTTDIDLGTATNGITMVAWDIIITCPDRSLVHAGTPGPPVDLTWLYYLLGVLGLLILIVLIIILSCCIYKKYGCLCKRMKPIKLTLLSFNPNRQNICRQESQIEIINDSELPSNLSTVKLSISSDTNEQENSGLNQHVDEQETQSYNNQTKDVTKLSAVFRDRQLPKFFSNPKVEPMYTDSIENYLSNGIQQRLSQAKLFRLDSGVFDDELDLN